MYEILTCPPFPVTKNDGISMLCDLFNYINLVPVAISLQDWLSSCTLHNNFGLSMLRGNTSFVSSIIVINGNTSRKYDDNAMYYASAVLRAI